MSRWYHRPPCNPTNDTRMCTFYRHVPIWRLAECNRPPARLLWILDGCFQVEAFASTMWCGGRSILCYRLKRVRVRDERRVLSSFPFFPFSFLFFFRLPQPERRGSGNGGGEEIKKNGPGVNKTFIKGQTPNLIGWWLYGIAILMFVLNLNCAMINTWIGGYWLWAGRIKGAIGRKESKRTFF